MTNCRPQPAPEIVKHFGQVSRFIIDERDRLASDGWVDISGLEHYIATICEEVCAISGEQSRSAIDALAALHTDLHTLSEELSTACADAINHHREAFNSNRTSEIEASQRDRLWRRTTHIR